jgi:hypothetical protein
MLILLIHSFSHEVTFSDVTLNGVVSRFSSIFLVKPYLFSVVDIILLSCFSVNTPGVPHQKYNVFNGFIFCISFDS